MFDFVLFFLIVRNNVCVCSQVHLLELEFEAKGVKQETSSWRKRFDLEFWT